MAVEEDIRDAQKELAAIAVPNGLLQLSLWGQNYRVEEIEVQELSESVLPKVSYTDFHKYLDRYKESHHDGESKLAILEVPYANDTNNCHGLPLEFYQREFFLDDPGVWKYLFPDKAAGWESRLRDLESLRGQITISIFHEMLKRDESLHRVGQAYQKIAGLVMELFHRVEYERSSLKDTLSDMRSFCEDSSMLKRKRRNIESVVTTLQEINEIRMLVQDIATTLESDEAVQFHQETIFEAYEDLSAKMHSLNKCLIIKSIANHGLESRLSNLLLRSLSSNLQKIYMGKDAPSLTESDEYEVIPKTILRFINVIGDSDQVVSCLSEQIDAIINDKACGQLNGMQSTDESRKSLSASLSTYLQRSNDESLGSELLSKYSVDIMSKSIKLDEHCKKLGLPNFDFKFIRKCSASIANIWESYFQILSLTLDDSEIMEPSVMNGILLHVCSIETACSSSGISDSFLSRQKGDFGHKLIKRVFQNCLYLLEKKIRDEKWEYETDISSFKLTLFDLLEIQGPDVAEVQDNAAKVLISGRYYGLVSSMDTLLKSLACLKGYSVIFKECSRSCAEKAEEILRAFNRLAYEMVLEVGAIRLGKLRSITVRHLSVCCEQITVGIMLVIASQKYYYLDKNIDQEGAKNFDSCVGDMRSHCVEIKKKIANVACELIIPLMKDATMALSSKMKHIPERKTLIPEFTELADAMVRNFSIVSKVTRSRLGVDEVDTMLENIWEESIVWLKDAALSHGSEDLAVAEIYVEHVKYLQEKLDIIYPARCIAQLRTDLEDILKP